MIYKIYGKEKGLWHEVDISKDKEEAILKGKSLQGYENYMVAKHPLDDDVVVIGVPYQECKVTYKDFKSKYKVKAVEIKPRAKEKRDLDKLTREYLDR